MDSTREILQTALTQSGELVIIDENNEGANAYAFRAQQPKLGREVFVKAFYYDEEDADDILREPKILVDATSGERQNDNLVQVFDGRVLDVGPDEQYFCMTMEYVEGKSLFKLLETEILGQQDAVRICSGILNGLAQLHRGPNRILHRDLKPANILLTKGCTPKITDFGSCAYLPEGCSSIGASRHSSLYVPPEGWQNPGVYSMSSDLYQVGIVLYELVNGPLDYNRTHWIPNSRLRSLKKEGLDLGSMDDFDRSQEENLGIAWFAERGKLLEHGRKARLCFSSTIKRIIKKATKPNIADRYQSVCDFATALSVVNVPNWIECPDGTFHCRDWRNWDWMVASVSRRSGTRIEVSRSRPGGAKWMRQSALESESFNEAFQKIEKLRK